MADDEIIAYAESLGYRDEYEMEWDMDSQHELREYEMTHLFNNAEKTRNWLEFINIS